MKHQVELNKRSDRWYALHVDGNLLGEFTKNREGHWFFYPNQSWRDSGGDSGWDATICKILIASIRQIKDREDKEPSK